MPAILTRGDGRSGLGRNVQSSDVAIARRWTGMPRRDVLRGDPPTLEIERLAAMFTFVVVVAIAAFVPYVAAPGIANGVKAVTSHPSADAGVPGTLPSAFRMLDAANRTAADRRDDHCVV